jgi:Rod binding domain-containing protein
MSDLDLMALGKMQNLPPAVQHQKITKASQEFEGLLLSALWKSMGEGMKESLGGGEGDSGGSSFIDMGLQAVSSGMAASGGIGIGRMLLKSLEKEIKPDTNTVQPDNGPK